MCVSEYHIEQIGGMCCARCAHTHTRTHTHAHTHANTLTLSERETETEKQKEIEILSGQGRSYEQKSADELRSATLWIKPIISKIAEYYYMDLLPRSQPEQKQQRPPSRCSHSLPPIST